MHYSELLEKYPRPEKSNRTAELAAMILHKSVKVEPVEAIDTEHASDAVVYPEFGSMAPHFAAYAATLLVNRAEQLHKLAEHDCNYGLSEAQEKRADKIKAEVEEIATALGFNVETGGDPRGAVVKLFDPADERAGDGWGGGWAVYR